MSKCTICPRKCNIDRSIDFGVCGVSDTIRISRAAPHFWEEPCISGYGGSGAVFFSGCNLKCIYCQNSTISKDCFGKDITPQRLSEIYRELIFEGVHNINLVTPTHFTDKILPTLEEGLPVPVIYNSSGYDSTDELKKLEGKIQIYLPDMKYLSCELSKKYSRAQDYPAVAKAAIREMFRQVGEFSLDSEGIMEKGVIIRHLMLPGHIENTLDVIDFVSEFNDKVIFSLMSQFTPTTSCPTELQSKITKEEYERAVDYIYLTGLENVYIQDFDSASPDFTPPFDLTGV